MRYFARGKLLLTAEYAVLGGATALAVPTKLGQWLEVMPVDTPEISWKSIDENGTVWYQNKFDKTFFRPKQKDAIANRLQKLFLEMTNQNPNAFTTSTGFLFLSTLDFNRNWGLGSSSTLVSVLAQWSGVNPYMLQQNVFGGSGYDIACATANGAISYQRNHPYQPKVSTVDFSPLFKEHLFFVYLNQKQDSQREVAAFDINLITSDFISNINALTNGFIHAKEVHVFQDLIQQHEEIISSKLGKTPIQKQYFPDYDGAIKSLGAWGGDFILVCGNAQTPTYFANKGYNICMRYEHLIYDASLTGEVHKG